MSHLVTPIDHLLVEMRKGKITRRVSLIDIVSKKKGKKCVERISKNKGSK